MTEDIRSAVIDSPLGKIGIVCDNRHLLKIKFVTSNRSRGIASALGKLGTRNDKGMTATTNKIIRKTVFQLNEYFKGKRKRFSLPICIERLRGTDFQKKIWRCLTRIPYGRTRTYAEVARMAGHPNACRAAGGANGKNPLPIVIPCHRVVAKNGIGGFSSGIPKKIKLLNLESRTPVKA